MSQFPFNHAFLNCLFSEGCGLWDLVINTLSESGDHLSLKVASGDETICHTKDLSDDFTRQEVYFAGMQH